MIAMNNLNYRIKRFGENEVSFIWIIIGIILYIYGFLLRSNLFIISRGVKAKINSWDLMLNFVSDIYLILYFITPILLFISLKIIYSEFEYTLLIRLGSLKKWIFFTMKQFIKKLFIVIFLIGVVTFLLLIGVPKDNGWSEFSFIREGIPSFPANILKEYLNSPIESLLLHIILFILTYISVHLFLTIIYILTRKFIYTVMTAVFFWILLLISLKWFPSDLPWLLFPNYFSLYHGVHFLGVWKTFLVVIMCLTLIFYLCTKVDSNFKGIISKIEWMYVIYALLFLLSLFYAFQQNHIQSIQDVFSAIFYGSSQYGANLISLFLYIVIYYGFVYFIQLHLNNELTNLGYYKILRYRSMTNWIWSCFRRLLISIIMLLVTFYIIIISIALIIGLNFNNPFSSKVTFLDISYHFFVNGFLQLLFYVLLAFIISWISKETFYSFVVLAILLLFMIPGINFYQIIPVGLNSMGYLFDGISPYRITITILLFIIIELITVYHLLNRTDFHKAN